VKRYVLFLLAAAVLGQTSAARADSVDDLIASLKPSSPNDAVWAASILNAVRSLEGDTRGRVRLCEKAFACGINSPAGYASALAAVDLLETLAPGKADAWRQKRLEVHRLRYTRGPRSDKEANGTAYVALLLAEARLCEDSNNRRDAIGHYRHAYQVARTLRLPQKKAIYDDMQAAANHEMMLNRIKTLRTALERNPKDALSRKFLVLTFLVDLDRPHEAAEHLDATLDPTLRKHVTMAAAEASALKDGDFLAQANWYRALAGRSALKRTKVRMLTRALENVNRYREVHTAKDFERLRADTLAAAIKAELAKLAAPPRTPAGSSTSGRKPPARPKGAVLVLTFEKDTLVTRDGQTYVRDTSGAGHHGRVTGGSLTPRAGGTAMVFDGMSHVGLGNPRGLQITGAITLSAWIKPKLTDGFRNIVAHGFCKMPNGEVQLRIANGRYEAGCWVGERRGGAGLKAGSDPAHKVSYAVPAGDVGTWVHLTGVYDGTHWRLYRNGREVASIAERLGAVRVNADWAVGAHADGQQRHFNGAIDEVMIFSRALSAEEIRRLCPADNAAGRN